MAASNAEARVPRSPAPGRMPVRVNVYDRVRWSPGIAALAPLTPYVHDGAIVPCLAVTAAGDDTADFEFFHRNEANESALCFGADGAPLQVGHLRKLPETHAVTLRIDDSAEGSYVVMVVTIRMSVDQHQEEEMILRCSSCHKVVFSRSFDVKTGPSQPHLEEFHALRYYVEWAKEYNADEANRICPSCGALQEPFPLRQFGWAPFIENGEVANRARSAALAAIEDGGRS